MIIVYCIVIKNDKILTSGYFVQHKDVEVQDLAINFLAQEHEISPSWEGKHQLIIVNESDQLGKVAYLSLIRLKWRKVRFLIKGKTDEMNQLEKQGKEEEAIKILEDVMHLKNSEMEYAKILGNTIVG